MTGPRDPTAFVRELTQHQTRLRAFIRCLLVDAVAVDDVLQETNALLWSKAAEFQPGTSFWAWASQTARFQVLTYCKKQRRDKLVFDEDLLHDLAVLAEAQAEQDGERRAALAHCLEKLPSPQRQLLDLRYGTAQSLDDIARALGRPVGSIRQTLYRIREALLKCIEQRLAEGGA